MPSMTSSEIDAFLKAPRHAIVGTTRADGSPQLSPVWYVYDGGRLYISVGAGTAKHHNLRRDPRVSVCIDGCHPDTRAVMIYGTAQVVEDDESLIGEMRWRIIRQYYETEEEARRYADEVRDFASVLLIITPHKIISQDFN